jgi:hypothetical protein
MGMTTLEHGAGFLDITLLSRCGEAVLGEYGAEEERNMAVA